MRVLLGSLMLAAAVAVANCGGSTGPTPTGCSNAGGGAAGTVRIGNILFRSGRNGTCNPAVDTVAAGTTVTWTWTSTGGTPHSVRSDGSTSFMSSVIMTGDGMTYSFRFDTPGTYAYDCAVHGQQMTGRVVVQ